MLQEKTTQKIDLEYLLDCLAPTISHELRKLPQNVWQGIQEIRLLEGRPIYLTMFGKIVALPKLCNTQKKITKQELEQSFSSLCEYSVHTYLPQIQNGFITIKGGHRIGLGGTAVLKQDEIISLREITSMNIRLARAVNIDVSSLCSRLFSDGLCSALIVGEPSSGKTTLLRAISTWLSKKDSGYIRVTVVDERGELMGKDSAYPDGCLDILRGFPKAAGILQAVRTLSPQIVVCDEIGDGQEVSELIQAMNCGVCFLGSIHAGCGEELLQRPQYQQLCKVHAISKVVFLKGAETPAQVAEIYRCAEDGSLKKI